MTSDNYISEQEREIIAIVKEKNSLTVDELYNEVYCRRIFNRSWIVKNSLKRLHGFGLIRIHNNRVFGGGQNE
jgi:predicted transcriptional regulator